MKTSNIILSVCIYFFINSCSKNEVTLETSIKIEKKLKKLEKKRYYTYDEYIKEHKEDFLHEKELTYFSLTTADLSLLNKDFFEATKEEIEGDISYNREKIKFDSSYKDILILLRDKKNFQTLVKHLNYTESDFDFIIIKNNKAIIKFLHKSLENFSTETYLLSIEENILKIKLISYIYT